VKIAERINAWHFDDYVFLLQNHCCQSSCLTLFCCLGIVRQAFPRFRCCRSICGFQIHIGFHALLFGSLFRCGFFIVFKSDLSVQTGGCMGSFVASGSDGFGCQLQREVMDCSASLDCYLFSDVSNCRLILIRGGGSRHDSHHESELSIVEEKVKESTEGTSKHRVEIDSSTGRIQR
jgi:hypothetical protein